MAKSSINFQKAKAHWEKHNARQDEPSYLLPPEFRKQNYFWRAELSPQEIFKAEHSKCSKGKRPRFENSHWEAVLNLNANHTEKDVERVVQHIAKTLNIIPVAIAIHRDEGHLNERGRPVYNYHAHLNFITVKDGRQNWRNEYIKPQTLRQLQTDVAELLGMERGKDKRETQVERLDHKQFKAAAKAKEAQSKAQRKELLAEIEKLRKAYAGQGYPKEFFRELLALKEDESLTLAKLGDCVAELIEKHSKRENDIKNDIKDDIYYEVQYYEAQEKLEAVADNLNELSKAAGLEITFTADSVTEPSLWQIFKKGFLSAFKSVVELLGVKATQTLTQTEKRAENSPILKSRKR